MAEIDNAKGGKVDTPQSPSVTDPKNKQRFTGDGAEDKRGEKTTKGLPEKVNEKMRKYLISNKLIELLYNQLQDELINHNLYRSFALYYRSEGLFKLERYFMLRAEEELLHHNWIFGYLAYCGIPLQYPEIPAINVDMKDELTPFVYTQDKEIETTQGINEIAKEAFAEGDFGTFGWLNGTGAVEGRLIPEQTEEMSISNDVYRIASQKDTDWITKEESILSYYLSKRGGDGNDDDDDDDD